MASCQKSHPPVRWLTVHFVVSIANSHHLYKSATYLSLLTVFNWIPWISSPCFSFTRKREGVIQGPEMAFLPLSAAIKKIIPKYNIISRKIPDTGNKYTTVCLGKDPRWAVSYPSVSGLHPESHRDFHAAEESRCFAQCYKINVNTSLTRSRHISLCPDQSH